MDMYGIVSTSRKQIKAAKVKEEVLSDMTIHGKHLRFTIRLPDLFLCNPSIAMFFLFLGPGSKT